MPTYKSAIVTFLDVLGFRELVTNVDAKTVNSKLDAVERFTRPSASQIGGRRDSFDPIVLQFSDAIVRIRPVDIKVNRQHPVGLVFHELLDLVHAQGELIGEGVLVRGGVSFGPIAASKGRVFGPALVAAYELESKYALYPRIAVDPVLLREFKANVLLKAKHHSLTDETDYVRRLLRQGDDGIWFIDYIRALWQELDDVSEYPDFLMVHRRLIVQGAARFQALSSTMSKYLWLASYHNALISELPRKWFHEYEVKRSDFKITSKDIPALQELASTKSLRWTP